MFDIGSSSGSPLPSLSLFPLGSLLQNFLPVSTNLNIVIYIWNALLYFFSVHVKKQLLLSRSMQVKASFCTYALQTLDCRLLICSSKCLRLYKILKDYIKIIQKKSSKIFKNLGILQFKWKKKKKWLSCYFGTGSKEQSGCKNIFVKIFDKCFWGSWQSYTVIF